LNVWQLMLAELVLRPTLQRLQLQGRLSRHALTSSFLLEGN
jgi:hypothetical protein